MSDQSNTPMCARVCNTVPREVADRLADSVLELRQTLHDSPERRCEKLANADIALDEYRKAVGP